MGNLDSLIGVELNKFFYGEIVKLLLNVYKRKIKTNLLKVKSLVSVSGSLRSVKNVSFIMAEDGLLETADDGFIGEITFEEKQYRISCYLEEDKNYGLGYYVSFVPLGDNKCDKMVKDRLLKLALNSCNTYSSGVFEVVNVEDSYSLNSLSMKKTDIRDKQLDDIFIDDEIKSDIERFIYTFKNFRDFEFPMRYLLSGKPGLGKSEVIRAVINRCKESGTVLIPKNFDGDFGLLFDMAKMYEPALVCIDDIDLFLGERESNYDKSALGEFLNGMDGLIQNKVFVIASTNDKKLVDFAASRPGRFDMIIDFGIFDPGFYLPLINSITENEVIVSLFNEDVLCSMEAKRVTGAFIVNLVKQLGVVMGANPEFTSEDLKRMVDRSFKGFYGSQLRESSGIGFTLKE